MLLLAYDRWMRWRIALGIVLVALALFGFSRLRAAKERRQALERPVVVMPPPRLEVQRALDAAARQISPVAKASTVAALMAAPRPDLDQGRAGPIETTIWKVRARVVESQLHDDGDIYLVIESGGKRCVAELPDPAKCVGSPFHDEIARLRKRLEAELEPTGQPKKIGREADLTGIGFFGPHGRANNGVRLMPLLELDWRE